MEKGGLRGPRSDRLLPMRYLDRSPRSKELSKLLIFWRTRRDSNS
jgi:hypothetical protein